MVRGEQSPEEGLCCIRFHSQAEEAILLETVSRAFMPSKRSVVVDQIIFVTAKSAAG